MNLYKKSDEIRNIFINYFKKNNHYLVNGSSLIPSYNDNSILFTNSGMNQFKNILLGKSDIKYKNIVTIQKCIRAGGKHNDFNQIGYTEYHHTFFEMLGNFSFNNYFKKESIKLAFDLITNNNLFNISKNKLIITVHVMDLESYNLWIKLGINKNNIFKIGSKNNFLLSDNFWKMGKYGPCGTSSEIFYSNENFSQYKSIKYFLKYKCIEIWNLVFMQFNYNKEKKLVNLPFNSVDTGMGLERISCVLQEVNSNYYTDIFEPILNIVLKYTNYKYINPSIKIISDHIRSIIFIINENIYPSNEGRGYVLRKIIRRSVSHVILLGIKKEFIFSLINPVYETMNFYKNDIYKNLSNIIDTVFKEENKFIKIINYGIKILNKKLKVNINYLESNFIFKLYDTYGLPILIINQFLKLKKIKYNKKKLYNLIKKQKIQSKININNF